MKTIYSTISLNSEKELTIKKEYSDQDIQDIYRVCADQETSAADAYQILSTIFCNLESQVQRKDEDDLLEQNFQKINLLFKGFKKLAAVKKNLLVYYLGEWNAKIETLQATHQKNLVTIQIQNAAATKHFAEIMEYVYREQVVQQNELVQHLGIDRSNLSRNMKQLKDAGLIGRSCSNKYVFYSLTPLGTRYYNHYLKIEGQFKKKERIIPQGYRKFTDDYPDQRQRLDSTPMIQQITFKNKMENERLQDYSPELFEWGHLEIEDAYAERKTNVE